jgi:endonuclease/exonuclease/phosphatase (EEP) superfamily protein YafD
MPTSRLVVATVNTYFGRTIKTPRGLAPLARADVILMQELFSPAAYGVETSLEDVGFDLVAVEGHSGLGIAVRSDSAYRNAGTPLRSTVLEQAGKAELAMLSRFSKEPMEYSDLGVLAAQLDGPGGQRLVAATTHLPVVTAFRQRPRFLSRLSLELADPYYDGLLVLTGDMNHWPGPRKADLALRRRVGLAAVDLGRDITWPSRRSERAEKTVNRFVGGQLDDILYRPGEMQCVEQEVVDVASDHRAVMATFTITFA